jgi:TetR/AcrR family transcriptional regulator, regulator of cefoperazone and chloramphenicol sensitivity
MAASHPPSHGIEGGADKGERARHRLLNEAARIFADKGYTRASTREICAAAGLNAAAIHYHFGGKDGLYRDVMMAPVQAIEARLEGVDDAGLTLPQALARLLGAFVGLSGEDAAPADQALAAQGLRLHLRELLEPNPAHATAVTQLIEPHHRAMARLLARHLGLAAPDDDVHRLVFAMVAMAHDYCISNRFMNRLAPGLLSRPDAAAQALASLVEWGLALVAHERTRRAAHASRP